MSCLQQPYVCYVVCLTSQHHIPYLEQSESLTVSNVGNANSDSLAQNLVLVDLDVFSAIFMNCSG